MRTFLITLFILQISFSAIGQLKQVKHVDAMGGNIKQGAIYSTVSVAGQTAVGRFSGSVLSGTIGYLDDDDLNATGVKQPNILLNNVSVFPNPNKGSFTVQIRSQRNATVQLTLIDVLGRIGQQRSESLSTGDNHFDFSGIPSGIWLVKVDIEGAEMVEKVSVEP